MNATSLGLLDAMAGRPIRQPRRGAHLFETDIDGVTVQATYDLDGAYFPGDEINPPERPEVIVRTVIVGGVELVGADAASWDERLELTEAVEEHEEDR